MDTQKANNEAKSKQADAEVYQEATKILVEKYGVDILDQLEGVDFSALLPKPAPVEHDETVQIARKRRYAPNPEEDTKPANVSCIKDDANCKSVTNNNYRSITGICNNVDNPNFGAANSPVARLSAKPTYANGIDSIRKAVSGQDLPSTRLISNLINQGTSEVFDRNANHFHMQFGQFIAHDIIFMPSSTGPNGQALDCSSCTVTNPNCAPIEIPTNDPYFPKSTPTTKSCMRLTRALNGQTGFGARMQIDQATNYRRCEAASVRSFSKGKLRQISVTGQGLTWFLPPQNKNDSNCQSKNPDFCFQCGDFRNSLHPGLIPLHVTFILEHNRIADAVAKARPTATDEQIYQIARRALIAMYQYAVYKEYLPKLLGQGLMNEFGLTPLINGNTRYNKTANPSLMVEFTTAAFRFGHSQARADFPRVDYNNKQLDTPVNLGSNIFYADAQYDFDGARRLLSGMLMTSAMQVDTSFSFPIRNQLFEIRGKPASGVDLIATNIMRGRDTGVAPYVNYRSFAKLSPVTKFDDLVVDMGADRVNLLKTVYANVNDIDLYVGILMEKPMNGALIGPTGGRIIAEQFRRLRDGDRFYFEHSNAGARGLTNDELSEIRKTNLQGLFCRFFQGIQNPMINQKIFDM
ncbi:hypothetical protein WR25_10081 isoform B [Diploscapter pachys]|uniref:Heme peroxidase n=1 Tax=Diploscapter pachys TaxID=2018661 RepID=A0A2A2LF94_9BILA|nr:hypothetical protein WR25_10081 isoform B [Diploscapter pachys]